MCVVYIWPGINHCWMVELLYWIGKRRQGMFKEVQGGVCAQSCHLLCLRSSEFTL